MTDKRSARLARSHDRQEQILDLISHGATYQHAAQELELTLPSVVSHLKRAYDRMGPEQPRTRYDADSKPGSSSPADPT